MLIFPQKFTISNRKIHVSIMFIYIFISQVLLIIRRIIIVNEIIYFVYYKNIYE